MPKKKYNELTEQQKQIDRYIAKKLLEQKNEIPDLWQINPEPHSWRRELGVEAEHFATFPRELVRIPILSSCPPNGKVPQWFIELDKLLRQYRLDYDARQVILKAMVRLLREKKKEWLARHLPKSQSLFKSKE